MKTVISKAYEEADIIDRSFVILQHIGKANDEGAAGSAAGSAAGGAADVSIPTPHKRPKRAKGSKERGRLTDLQKRENVELSKTRVIVENTNRRLKMYKILGSKLRHYWP